MLTPKSRKNRSTYNYNLNYDSNGFSSYIDKTFGDYLKSNDKPGVNFSNNNYQRNYINNPTPTGNIRILYFLFYTSLNKRNQIES